MSWADDVGAATYGTKTSNIGAGVPDVLYSRKFLPLIAQKLQLMRFAQMKPLPEGNGLTVEWNRPRPLGLATTALTESVNPNASALKRQKIQATIKEYGDWVQISSLVLQGHINQEILDAVPTLSAQAAETMELLLQMEVCSNGIYPVRADLDATKEYTGTLGAVTSGSVFTGGAALEANTNYGDTNDDLNQSIITMLSGPAKGESRTVTDYVAAGSGTGTANAGAITLTTAFNMTPEVGDSFRVCSPDALAAADDMSYANCKHCVTVLKNQKAEKSSGNKFACVVTPDQSKNLMDDADWKAVNEYKDRTRGVEDMFLGSFAGADYFETTMGFQFPIYTIGTAGTSYGPGSNGANYSASGAIATALFIGKNSFGATAFAKKGNSLQRPPVRTVPSTPSHFNPLGRYATAGWVMEAAFKSTYSLHCIGLWTYSS